MEVLGVVDLGVDPLALVGGVGDLAGLPLALVGGVGNLRGLPAAVHVIIPVLGLLGLGVSNGLGLVPVLGLLVLRIGDGLLIDPVLRAKSAEMEPGKVAGEL